MNAYTLDKAVILSRLIVWLIFVAGAIKTAVPNRILRLYSYRVNMLAILPFSGRWQRAIAPEHLEAYGRSRRWIFGGLVAILVTGLLRFSYFNFLFMRVHGFDQIAKNMALHVEYTALRPEHDADKERAATLVTNLQHVLAKYQDYHVAEADGFKPFHPEIKVPIELFGKDVHGPHPPIAFDLNQPHWLLYSRTPEGGYKLVGATYAEPNDASEDRLNKDIPLSVARWRRDVNLCLPARGTLTSATDRSKFGYDGSIATKQACDAVGGRFFPVLSGWTVEVHPWEQNPKLVWPQQ